MLTIFYVFYYCKFEEDVLSMYDDGVEGISRRNYVW